jgi:hypothetical protein
VPLKTDDLIDIIVSHIQKAASSEAPKGRPSKHPPFLLKGRPFVTEYDIKRALTGGKTRLTLAKDAILSPLATDWLILNRIEIVRE